MVVRRKELRSVPLQGGEVRRILVTIGQEPVVLFQKSHPTLAPRFSSRRAWQEFARQTRVGETRRAEARAWNRGLRFQFNCHTLAVGAFFGLGPTFWLEGSRSLFTLMENPTQTLLDAYFEPLMITPFIDRLPTTVQDDDVVVLADTRTGDLVHSGRIKWSDSGPVVLSKLGEHPVALTSFEALTGEYAGQYNRVQLYRSLLSSKHLFDLTTLQAIDVRQDLGDRPIESCRDFTPDLGGSI